MSFILEPTELLNIDLFAIGLIVNSHLVNFQLISSFECNELSIETFLFRAEVMGHFEMVLKVVIILVVTVFILRAADVARDVLEINMDSEFVVVEEVLFAEVAIWMQKDNVAELINVSSLQVLVKLVECIQFLLFEYTSLLLETDITKNIRKKVTKYAGDGLISSVS